MQHTIGDDALRLMLAYDWPGNVRELENCVERACTTCSFSTIHVADLPTGLRNFQGVPQARTSRVPIRKP